jgi:hypothetical protein
MIALCRRIVDTGRFETVFVIMSLVIAIITDNLEKVKNEPKTEADARAGDLAVLIGVLRGQLQKIGTLVRRNRMR